MGVGSVNVLGFGDLELFFTLTGKGYLIVGNGLEGVTSSSWPK